MAKTVMIVEDNELNMKLFRDLLEAHGYQTVESRDGLSALKVARDHNPDLILMDIQLQVRIIFVVTQNDVEPRFVLFDEICLQDKRFEFSPGDNAGKIILYFKNEKSKTKSIYWFLQVTRVYVVDLMIK